MHYDEDYKELAAVNMLASACILNHDRSSPVGEQQVSGLILAEVVGHDEYESVESLAEGMDVMEEIEYE